MSDKLIERNYKIEYEVTDNAGEVSNIECLIDNCDDTSAVFAELYSRHKGSELFINELIRWDLLSTEDGGGAVSAHLIIGRKPEGLDKIVKQFGDADCEIS